MIIVLGYVGGEIRQGPAGAEYTVHPRITISATESTHFSDVKNEIYKYLGCTEEHYLLEIFCRYDIGAPGPHFFQLIPLYEESGWRMIFQQTVARTNWRLIELYIEPKQLEMTQSLCDNPSGILRSTRPLKTAQVQNPPQVPSPVGVPSPPTPRVDPSPPSGTSSCIEFPADVGGDTYVGEETDARDERSNDEHGLDEIPSQRLDEDSTEPHTEETSCTTTFKTILEKLTPQNYDKLFEQIKELNINNSVTLAGVVSQIFEKALMEPSSCDMYANICSHLSHALPVFIEDSEKITFKRLLLNKCQEEFERGEREEAEAEKTEEDGEVKQTQEEREEKRVKARRRMLGNIRLIGELYKKRMLTERIMHECIKKLLGQSQSPDEEDIEALCKLMSTIGEMIDHPKAKEHMDAYFDIMSSLSTNQKYSSRVRFMLKDAIDLRKNKWQQRRKVEGPKKIEEVHRDAAQERQAQVTQLARGGPLMDNSPMRWILGGLAGQFHQWAINKMGW